MIPGATRIDTPSSPVVPAALSAPTLPPELRSILEPAEPGARDAAWDAFVARYSRLFVYMASRVMPDRDGAMDAYTYLLEQLRKDGYRALRAYVADSRSRFSTWIAVVARRTCVDFFRQRYGRQRGQGKAAHVQAARAARLNLIRLPTWTPELSDILAHTEMPDRQLRSAELHQALDAARSTLSAEDRLLLQLRFDEDLSAAAIASILGMPSPFHVYRRLKTVCDELRRRLTARGIEGSAP
jgi:RNA polymerase sigma factor (sigma-70 family)